MKKNNLIYLLFIVATAIFLRVFKIASNFYFTGELGKELLYIRQFALSHTLPAAGMATSHEWLSYGPFYYWIMIPIFNFFNGSPFILFWSALAVSALGIVLSYMVVEKIAGEKIALFSAIIQSLSPLLIWQTRLSKLHVFFFILSPLLMLFAFYLWRGERKWVFWAGIVYGLMFSFHFSQIPILGVMFLIFFIKRNAYKLKEWLLFAAGTALPNITLIWQDRDLAVWLPYRVLNFADKDPVGTLGSLTEYLGKNIFWDSRLWAVGLIVFAVLFAHYAYTNRKRLTQEFLPFYLVASIGFMLLANILHGSPPVHYFLPIFTTLPIFLAVYLSKTKFWPFIIAPIFLVNLFSFNGDALFYGEVSKTVPSIGFVPYVTQKTAASFIVSDAKGKEIYLRRIGPYDYFPEQYSQNYKYLILLSGGKPSDKSGDVYTIRENVESREIVVEK